MRIATQPLWVHEFSKAVFSPSRRRGRKGGRRKAIDPQTFAMALQLYKARTSSVQSICTRLGIARRTFYRDLAAHRIQPQEQVEVSSEVVDYEKCHSTTFPLVTASFSLGL